MAKLYIYNSPNNLISSSENIDEINSILAGANIQLEIWETLKLDSDSQILEAYKDQIQRIMHDYNFRGVDVVAVKPSQNEAGQEKLKAMREKFLAEHTHSDDEVRFFIAGQGLFCVHHENQIFQILCTAGDFIRVPAMTKHWFDMGPEPMFQCIRFFGDEKGWVADYTGASIANEYPDLTKYTPETTGLLKTNFQICN